MIILAVAPVLSGNMVIIGTSGFIRTADIPLGFLRRVAVNFHDTLDTIFLRSMNKHTDYIFIVPKHIPCGSANDDAAAIVGNSPDDLLLGINGVTDCAGAQIQLTQHIGSVFMNV